jgi:hypothetical protein
MPTVYSLGKAKIVGIASLFGVAFVNNRRSAANISEFTSNQFQQHNSYSYLILSDKISRLKIKVRKLAIITGQDWMKIPYNNHKNTPVQKVNNITNETSAADFVFQVFTTCGKKAIVVKVAARNPKKSIFFIDSKTNKVLSKYNNIPQSK